MTAQTFLRWLNIALAAGIGVLLVLQFFAPPLKDWAKASGVRDGGFLVVWVAVVCSRAIDPRHRMRPVSWAFLATFILTLAGLFLVPLARSREVISENGYSGLSLGLLFANLIFGACVVGFQINAKVAQA